MKAHFNKNIAGLSSIFSNRYAIFIVHNSQDPLNPSGFTPYYTHNVNGKKLVSTFIYKGTNFYNSLLDSINFIYSTSGGGSSFRFELRDVTNNNVINTFVATVLSPQYQIIDIPFNQLANVPLTQSVFELTIQRIGGTASLFLYSYAVFLGTRVI